MRPDISAPNCDALLLHHCHLSELPLSLTPTAPLPSPPPLQATALRLQAELLSGVLPPCPAAVAKPRPRKCPRISAACRRDRANAPARLSTVAPRPDSSQSSRCFSASSNWIRFAPDDSF